MGKLFDYSALVKVLTCLLCTLIAACGVLKEQKSPDVDIGKLVSKPLPPEKTGELIEEVGTNWFYGQGVGNTAIAATTAIVFPPYAVYLLGNAALTVGGYEPLNASDLLPDEDRQEWCEFYDTIASGPGRLNAAVAGREFRTKEAARENVLKIIQEE